MAPPKTSAVPKSARDADPNTFTVTLKAHQADWLRAAAAMRRQTPVEFLQWMVAQGRASDGTKGGTATATGERPAELARLGGAPGGGAGPSGIGPQAA